MKIKHITKAKYWIDFIDEDGNEMCVADDYWLKLSATYKGTLYEFNTTYWKRVGRGRVPNDFHEWVEEMEKAVYKEYRKLEK